MSRAVQAPGQMVLDLFPEDKPKTKSPLESCIEWLVEGCGCDEGRIKTLAAELFGKFGEVEGWDRARCLGYFYGSDGHEVPRLKACPLSLMGMFDPSIDYHTLWDRCWAARWVPLREALEVKEWHYNYRSPYTGAPVWVWYIDNRGCEVKRPYDG